MMNRYSDYKETGVEWVEKIPSLWKLAKLKWLSNIYAGGTPNTNIDEYWEGGTIPWLNSGAVNQKRITVASNYITEKALQNSSAKWVPKGSLVMALAGQGKTKGTVAILNIDATCNQSMAAIVPDCNSVNGEYLFYWLDCNYERIRGLAGDEVRDGLNLEIIGSICTPLPSFNEQSQIVRFLDYQTGLIDTIIAKKQKLIELLKEKRQSVINEAVTQGLNPNVQLKDSGVEWLGEVPEHWKVLPLRYLNNKVGSGVTPKGGAESYTEEGIVFIRSQNVHFDGLRLDDVARIDLTTHNEMSNSKVQYNDVLLNITGASIGRCCVVKIKEEMNVNQHVCIIRPRTNKVVFEYLNLVLSSGIGQAQVRMELTGGNRDGLTIEAIKAFVIPLPEIHEQEEIVATVSGLLNQVQLVESKILTQIEKLKEYRQSLISEAVTGKIDVRDWEPLAA